MSIIEQIRKNNFLRRGFERQFYHRSPSDDVGKVTWPDAFNLKLKHSSRLGRLFHERSVSGINSGAVFYVLDGTSSLKDPKIILFKRK